MDYEELARRLQSREEQAFLDFVEAFGRLGRAFFLSAGLPPFEAEDLARSCMTDIPLKVRKYQQTDDGSFKAWVFALMRNAAMDWKRRRQRNPLDPLPDDLPDAAILEITPRVMRVAAVHEALARLSAEDRQVVELRDLAGAYTYKEIGVLVNISETAARVRHHRALKRLAAMLREDPRIDVPADVRDETCQSKS
jgi:RNA polymerase sigma factor (sigma-70 family)